MAPKWERRGYIKPVRGLQMVWRLFLDFYDRPIYWDGNADPGVQLEALSGPGRDRENALGH